MIAGLRRWRSLGGRDRLLLGEALLMLAFSRAAIRLLPFAKVMRIAARGSAPPLSEEAGAALARRIGWAVLAAARRVPFRALCFEQGLAAQIMLRRRGAAAVLHYGARIGADGKLKAHVWVRAGAAAVVGCEISADFAELARAPPQAGGQ